MKTVTIKAPAKINLTLEVLDKRADGFHNIKSIMQAISLCDFLRISLSDADENCLELSGSSDEIPYDERNIIHKAWKLMCEENILANKKIEVYVEKNIPVAAGLAGGSTDAAGFLYGVNYLLENKMSENKLNELCARLGSDLNFCLTGGCAFCTSRGEIIRKLPSVEKTLSLIKPKKLGISAGEAYKLFSQLTEDEKKVPDYTDALADKIRSGAFDEGLVYNSLEKGLFEKYEVLKKIKTAVPHSLMSGSGSTFFIFGKVKREDFDLDEFDVIEDLCFLPYGAAVCEI